MSRIRSLVCFVKPLCIRLFARVCFDACIYLVVLFSYFPIFRWYFSFCAGVMNISQNIQQQQEQDNIPDIMSHDSRCNRFLVYFSYGLYNIFI